MSKGTLAHQAEVLLREWIVNGRFAKGHRLPSERSLAGELGVQRYALGRAMARLVIEGLVVRKGYKIFVSDSKQIERTFSCDLVISERSSHLKSYIKIAAELGVDCAVHRYGPVEEAVAILQRLDSDQTESIIFDPPYGRGIDEWEKAASLLVDHGIPIICIGNPTHNAAAVLPDYPRALELVFDYLQGLNHREFALMSPPSMTPIAGETIEAWGKLCRQRNLFSSASRIQIPNRSIFLREDVADLVDRLTGEWSEVTALIYFSDAITPLSQLLEILAKKKKRIPEDLSLVCLEDSKILRHSSPSITATNCDLDVMQEIAFRMIQRLSRKRGDSRFSPADCVVRVQPRLVPRSSTGAIKAERSRFSAENPPASNAVGERPRKSVRDLVLALRQPYDLVTYVGLSRFHSLDLTAQVNRPLNFRRGWLGDLPLKNFAPGQHVIHGVPFKILGGAHHSDCGAVVFRSNTNAKGRGGELPSQLQISVQQQVRAIYILHGCGYAGFLKPFATYKFCGDPKCFDEVSLVPLGQPPANYDAETLSRDFLRANIQDWWPDFIHRDFPGARMAPIDEGETSDPIPRHAYLYTLEWINPFPERWVSHLEITTDETQSTTLGLLAISVLAP